MQLPDDFCRQTLEVMGSERFERYLKSFEEEVPVSIRLNARKVDGGEQTGSGHRWTVADAEAVPWCRHGYYLHKRPNFTFDPLLHAGCYYVQEAASMFLDEVLRQLTAQASASASQSSDLMPHTCLDLCAAPGGKSTLLRAALPADSVLYSNEPVRQRASILLENVQKWGYDRHIVTNSYPRDFRRAKMRFDLILCDVPCSGEGMFRKDPATIGEWSRQHVDRCQQLQRDIVSDAWECLNDGGLLIYSTCTYNLKENEENVRWMLDTFDAQALHIATRPEWHITGSLLPGFAAPVYRFIPGITRSEGLFMCVLQKGGLLRANPKFAPCKLPVSTVQTLPLHADGPQAELSYQQALAYLRHEALTLPADAPRGIVEVCFMGQSLGLVKNIGTRANNLYPKEWKIKTTHIPNDYEPILQRI